MVMPSANCRTSNQSALLTRTVLQPIATHRSRLKISLDRLPGDHSGIVEAIDQRGHLVVFELAEEGLRRGELAPGRKLPRSPRQLVHCSLIAEVFVQLLR